jgi:hypothetical protein
MSLYGNRGVHGQTVDAIARRVLSGEWPESATLDITVLQAELGVTVDEDAVRAADRNAHQWRNPVWRHPDGSLAEW